ncbi:MAG: hypothetical protein RR284_05945 [Ruthenibacterium sp.]
MGFFSSKTCPICGGTTPKLLAKKIEGQPICSKCANDIMADDDLVKKWSLADLRVHLNARAENFKTVQNFTPTRTVEYEHEVVIDDAKRLFYISQFTVDNPPVFNFDDITGFTVERGYHKVESWSRGMERTPYNPVELSTLGHIAALADIFSDDETECKCENLTVTLKLNTPNLHEYELFDVVVSGDGPAEYAADFSCEMSKVNTVCNLIISLTKDTAR